MGIQYSVSDFSGLGSNHNCTVMRSLCEEKQRLCFTPQLNKLRISQESKGHSGITATGTLCTWDLTNDTSNRSEDGQARELGN